MTWRVNPWLDWLGPTWDTARSAPVNILLIFVQNDFILGLIWIEFTILMLTQAWINILLGIICKEKINL
jgi:hypothetical protein